MPRSPGSPPPRSPWPLRVAILACVATAVLVPTLRIGRRAGTPLRLFDVSASIPERARALPPETGEHLLFANGVSLVVPGERSNELARDRTRLAEALVAAGSARKDRPSSIWIVTDGRDTEGGAEAAAAALAAQGHRVYVTAPEPAPVDVALASARIVSTGRLGPTTIRARAEANVSGRARLVLRRDGEVRATTEIALAPGVAREVELVDAAGVLGPTLFEVLLAPLDGTPDDDPRNDRVALPVTGDARLALVIDADPWPPFPAPAAVEVRSADVVDPALGAAADLLVVSDVPWRRLGVEGTERLRRHLALGGTVLLLGGSRRVRSGRLEGDAARGPLAPAPASRRGAQDGARPRHRPQRQHRRGARGRTRGDRRPAPGRRRAPRPGALRADRGRAPVHRPSAGAARARLRRGRRPRRPHAAPGRARHAGPRRRHRPRRRDPRSRAPARRGARGHATADPPRHRRRPGPPAHACVPRARARGPRGGRRRALGRRARRPRRRGGPAHPGGAPGRRGEDLRRGRVPRGAARHVLARRGPRRARRGSRHDQRRRRLRRGGRGRAAAVAAPSPRGRPRRHGLRARDVLRRDAARPVRRVASRRGGPRGRARERARARGGRGAHRRAGGADDAPDAPRRRGRSGSRARDRDAARPRCSPPRGAAS